MQRIRKLSILLLCAVLMLVPLSVCAHAEDAKDVYNKYNIVLVADSSGSMRDSDGAGNRFEAIGQFVGLLANKGNMVGAVVFNNGVLLKSDKLLELSDMNAKNGFVSHIKEIPVGGYTNIGQALTEANKLLESGKKENPSIIVLLTDGNTEMPSEKETEEALEKKADAIQTARENGTAIYSIILNADGSADASEMQQIANATGGKFKEVRTSADLKEVFALFYAMIYNTEIVSETLHFDANGRAEKTFIVPAVGVEEANIIVDGTMTNCDLEKPSGELLKKADMAGAIFTSKSFTIVKMVKPQSGTWRFTAYGTPGDEIKIDLIYNTDISVTMDTDGLKETNDIGDKIKFTVKIKESGNDVPSEKYDNYEAVVIFSSGDTENTVPMSKEGNSFVYDYDVKDYGSFNVFARIVGEGYEKVTGPVFLNVGNKAPVTDGDFKKTIYVLPFSSKAHAIDLSGYASDPDGDTLSYKVLSSAYMEDEYTIDGSDLVMQKFSLMKGSFAIQASDSQGASCAFNLLVIKINIGLVALLLMVLGGLIFLAVVLLIIYRERITPFYGTIIVNGVQQSPIRGRLLLSSFNCGAFGFDPKAYFQACGRKKQVLLRSKKPLYTPGGNGEKEIVIQNGAFVTVYADPECTSQISIQFRSMLS